MGRSTDTMLVRVTVAAGGTGVDDFTLTQQPNVWQAATSNAFPSLRLIPNLSTTPQIVFNDQTSIPAGLGLVAAYSTTHTLSVRLQVSLGDVDEGHTTTHVGISDAPGGGDEIKWFELKALEKTGDLYTLVWAPDATTAANAEDASGGQHVSLRLFARICSSSSAEDTPALLGDSGSSSSNSSSHPSIGQFDLFVARPQSADTAPATAAHDEIEGDGAVAPPAKLATPDGVHSSHHMFYEMIRYREQRTAQPKTPADSTQHLSSSTAGDSRSPQSTHPLFGKWVPEDSPAFRSAIHSMEEQALSNRSRYKDLARHSTSLREAYQQFMRQLRDATGALESLPVFQPLLSCLIEPLKHDINQMLNTMCTNWDQVVITNARRLYDSSFKHLDAKKSEFEEASNHYYDELGKYLKAKTSDEDKRRDLQFAKRRAAFDVARWSYFVDLWTASGGWSELELFVAVLKWAKSAMKAHAASKLPAVGDSDVAWYLASIPAIYEEIRAQKIEASQFQTSIENHRYSSSSYSPSPAPSEYNTATSEEPAELSGFARVSHDAASPAVASKDRRRLNMLRLSAVQSPDNPNQLLSAMPPVPPIDLEHLSDAIAGQSRKSADRKRDADHHAAPNDAPQAGVMRRPLASGSNDGTREGFLFARVSNKSVTTTKGMMATSTSVWRRYWCVAKDGKFQKFAHWKSLGIPEPKGEPIELNTATVRELSPDSKQASKRRFCFEVITPHYYGVFQATSDQDLHVWVEVLRRAIELSLLNTSRNSRATGANSEPAHSGNSADKQADGAEAEWGSRSSRASGPEPAKTALSAAAAAAAAASAKAAASESSPSESFSAAGATSDASGSLALGSAPHSTMYGALAGLANFDPGRRLSLTSLLPMLQQDEANEHCADCGTQMPEWCSLNLGCLLCIECSGIHRSLGTHISKVRSLTLDVISFTPVTISMLLSTGNALNADVFEPLARRTGSGGGGVLLQKPSADGSRGEKQQYIHAKYVAREFVDHAWQPGGKLLEAFRSWSNAQRHGQNPQTFWDAESATALLFAAIEVGDLSATMRSLALGAGLNAMRQIPTHTDDVSVAATPLAAALFGTTRLLKAQSRSASTSTDGGSVQTEADGVQTHLEIAELLILNGANVNLRDKSQRTPLHIACVLNSTSAIKYLVDKGADPLLATETGQTPLDLLSSQQHAARSIITSARQRAEQRNMLSQPSPTTPTSALSGSTGGSGSPNRPLRRGNSFTSSRGGNTSIRLSSVGDRVLETASRHDHSVFAAARKFTQSLAPSGAVMGRVSVSTERPSLLEINGSPRSSYESSNAGQHPSGQPSHGWLASLSAAKANKRGRRLTSGIREFGHKLAGSQKGHQENSRSAAEHAPAIQAPAQPGEPGRAEPGAAPAFVSAKPSRAHYVPPLSSPIAEEGSDVADDESPQQAACAEETGGADRNRSEPAAAGSALSSKPSNEAVADLEQARLASIPIPPIPTVMPPPFESQYGRLTRSTTVSGPRSQHTSKSPSISAHSHASLSRSSSVRSSRPTRSASQKSVRKMFSNGDISIAHLSQLSEKPQSLYASSVADSYVEVQGSTGPGKKKHVQADDNGTNDSKISLAERPTSEGKPMKTQVLKRRAKNTLDAQGAASYSADDISAHTAQMSHQSIPIPGKRNGSSGHESPSKITSSSFPRQSQHVHSTGGSKRLFRLIPKPSRMAFNGMFGRGDKKNAAAGLEEH